MSILSTSWINSTLESYKQVEINRRINPLETRKQKYSGLSSAWGTLKSKLGSLQSILSDLKSTSDSSIFNSKSSNLSKTDFFSVSASNTAISSAYTLKVNQLAKGDLAVSSTYGSSGAAGLSAGKHVIEVKSGDYTGTAEVDVSGSEDYETLMKNIATALNNDKAVVKSTDPAANITTSGTLEFDVGGTKTEISYDYSNATYSEVVDDLVSKINDKGFGVTASNDSGTLNLSVDNKDKYITIGEKSGTSGTLASSLGIDVTKEKGTGGMVSASTFSPSTGNSKLSILAKDTGYDNRLIMSDKSGGALNSIGFTSSVLTNHTTAPDDNSAGFKYDVTSASSNDLNSKIIFNGINIQRNSNSIEDLLQGVTIDLKAEQESSEEAVSFSVSNNTDEIKGKIDEFIKQFNESYSYIRSNYFSDKNSRGLFVGDPSASSLMRKLQTTAMGNVSGLPPGNLDSLYDLGISFDTTNGLVISDSSKLKTAIDEDAGQVAAVFNSSNGVASSLHTVLDDYLGFDGSITKMIESYDSSVNYYNDRIKATNERIDKGTARLRTQYEQLQMNYAEMLNMQSFFSSSSGGFL
ncbi:MAG: flagellar filament capping protein FliD [Rhodothermaceae bacterium]